MSAPSRRPYAVFLAVGLLVAGAYLGASVGPVPAAPAATAPAPGTTDAWAYGANQWFNVTFPTGHGVRIIQAHVAWYAVFDRTNVSATVAQLDAEHWALSNYTSYYCSPDCSAPEVEVALQHATYEHAFGHLNVTRNGTVYEGASAVPAVGLLNSSATDRSWAYSDATIAVATPSGVKHIHESFDARGSSQASLSFSPAQGQFPLQIRVGDHWNATSSYTGSGGWSVDWSYEKTNASGQTTSLTGHPSSTLPTSGRVSMNGTAVGSMSLPNGSTVPTVVLDLGSAFEVLDGTILLPNGSSLFNDGLRDWDCYQMGFAAFRPHELAVQYNDGLSSFRLRAASAFYGTNDSGVAMGEMGRSSMGGRMLVSAAESTSGVPTTEITAQPMAPETAKAAALCLSGTSCGSGAAEPVAWESVAIVGIVAGAAVLVVVGAYLSRRRRT